LDEAIILYRESVQLIPLGHSDQPTHLANLAHALYFNYTKHPEPQVSDLEDALKAFSDAVNATHAHALQRFDIALSWAAISARHKYHKSALKGYTAAIQLLLQIASVGLEVNSQQKLLKIHSVGLASDAAACALELEHVENALEMLEAGRSIFWQQSLWLQAPLDELRDVRADLADELSTVSRALKVGSLGTSLLNLECLIDLEEVARHSRRLEERWQQLVEEVHQVQGFEDFLQPVPFSQLCKAAGSGVVVVLNVSKYCCDAKLVSLDQVKLVKLPNFSFEDAQVLGNTMVNAAHGVGITINEVEFENTLEEVLQDLWDNVVHPIYLALQEFSVDCHLWWLPTGPLLFLPLRAAGLKNKLRNVSSYTLTLSSLLHARQQASNTTAEFHMLCCQPTITTF
jgi:hypothetical protein